MEGIILVVEDSAVIHSMIRQSLKIHNLKFASSISDANAALVNQIPELIILDINLPDGDGFKFASELKLNDKYKHIKIIFLTGKNAPLDKVQGFELGAEDYIVKPFEPLEFRARIDSQIRKAKQLRNSEDSYIKGNFKVETTTQKVLVKSNNGEFEDLNLTSKEFKLMIYFLRNESLVLTREQILKDIWGPSVNISDRTIDTHIYALRKKLGDFGKLIKTISKLGYQFSQIS